MKTLVKIGIAAALLFVFLGCSITTMETPEGFKLQTISVFWHKSLGYGRYEGASDPNSIPESVQVDTIESQALDVISEML